MPKKTEPKAVSLKLSLPGRNPGDATPNLAICPIDADGKVIETKKIPDSETFEVSAKAMATAKEIAIVSGDAEPEDALKSALRLSPEQLKLSAATDGRLTLAPDQIRKIFPAFICISGDVERCWYWPWWTKAISEQAWRLEKLRVQPGNTLLTDAGRRLARLRPSPELNLTLAPTCRPICDGIVEVFERVCCRRPIVIDDLLRARLLERLEQIRLPDLPIPKPSLDPVPYGQIGVFRDGAVDEAILNAEVDSTFLKTADLTEIEPYVTARPYLQWLWWSCGAPVNRGVTAINPDGTFTLCHPMTLAPSPNCKRQYAFKVTQIINEEPVVIYDGLGAGNWFDSTDDISLRSFHPSAIPCGSEPPVVPSDTAFAMLQSVGGMEAWNLKTPAQDSRNGTATPDPVAQNDGLAFPTATPAEAVGQYRNRNWAGILNLRYLFTDPLYAQARFYRVSVSQADGNGNPVGGWTYLDDPISWVRYEVAPITIIREQLNVPDAPQYYKIPDPSLNWLSGYGHARLDTRAFANGRHLVRLELYDINRDLIRPQDAPAGHGGISKPFSYEWWHDAGQALGVMPETTTNVPQGALTHMFWWDNRDCIAEIVNLVNDGTVNTGNCQFISGEPDDTFAATIRASHAVPAFMQSWQVRYQKGLYGGWTALDSGTAPVDPDVTDAATLLEMLEGDTRCTFSLELYVHTKAYNGTTVNLLDERDNASFALDQSG